MDTFAEDVRERWKLQKREQRRRRKENTAHVVISNQEEEEEDDSPITSSDIRKRQKKRDAQRRYRAKKAAQQAHEKVDGWQDMTSKLADDLFVEDDGIEYFSAGAGEEDVFCTSGAMSDEGRESDYASARMKKATQQRRSVTGTWQTWSASCRKTRQIRLPVTFPGRPPLLT